MIAVRDGAGCAVTTKNAVLVLGAWMMLAAAGCAIGTPAPVGAGESPLDPGQNPTAGAGGTGMPDAMVPNMPDTGTAMFVGDACAQGTMETCACAGSMAMGQRICVANPASPTGGALSECQNCPMPDAGNSGEGGMGGASGMSGMGGASGMAGTGGTGGTAGGPACMCMDALACCRDDGTCGVGVPGLCF